MEKVVDEKRVLPLDKEMYKIEDGKVVITSDELARAIQDESIELFVDEEQAASLGGIGFACPCV
ncbi:MAG: hypothetical protein E6929_12425 [Clostridium sp.]|nr:hypothetical protein [Clostridium sp.]